MMLHIIYKDYKELCSKQHCFTAFNLLRLEKCYILYFLVPLVFNYTSCHKKQWESRVREEGGGMRAERRRKKLNLGFRFSGNF